MSHADQRPHHSNGLSLDLVRLGVAFDPACSSRMLFGLPLRCHLRYSAIVIQLEGIAWFKCEASNASSHLSINSFLSPVAWMQNFIVRRYFFSIALKTAPQPDPFMSAPPSSSHEISRWTFCPLALNFFTCIPANSLMNYRRY